MLEVRLRHRLYGAEDGQIHPRWFEAGETVRGDLARSAIESGHAEVPEERKKPEPANKMRAEPENKALSFAPRQGRRSRSTT